MISLQSSAQAEALRPDSCVWDWGTTKWGRIGRVKERKERGKGREVNKVSRSLPVGVLRGQLACQWTRPSGCNWDRFVPGLLLMCTTGQSAPIGKEQETLLTSLPFPLSFLSLTLPILPCFSSPSVLDAGIWSKGPQPELRIGD